MTRPQLAAFDLPAEGAAIENLAQDSMEESMDLPPHPTYGVKPALDACKERAEIYLRSTLKDYDSAIFEWESTELSDGAFEFDDGQYHSVCYLPVLVNAKNSFGAYAGKRRWAFAWKGTELFGVSTDGGFEWVIIN